MRNITRLTRLLALMIALLLIGCEAVPPATDTTDAVILNNNSNLTLGSCERNWFDIPGDGFDRRYYNQCTPAGYTLYQDSCNDTRVDVEYTGAVYSFLIGGRCGTIGYTLPPTVLPVVCIVINVNGQFDNHSYPGNLFVDARMGVSGGAGYVQLPRYSFIANGDYLAQFYYTVETPGIYDVTVYFSQTFINNSTESYATIESIEVFEVTAGHCQ